MWKWSLSLHEYSNILIWTSAEDTCGNDSHGKETKHIHMSAADLLHIRMINLNLGKCGQCKNEARNIDCLCCREGDAMLISSAKIL